MFSVFDPTRKFEQTAIKLPALKAWRLFKTNLLRPWEHIAIMTPSGRVLVRRGK